MRHVERCIFLIAATLVIGSVFGCNASRMPAATSASSSASVIDSSFRSQVGVVDDMNRGLTLRRIGSVATQDFPTPPPNYISFLVLNHTTESIRFANVGFGTDVFEFDAGANQWRCFKLPYTPEGKETLIPAKLETLNFKVLNTWDISPDDLAGVASSEIRIFVSGTGTETQKRYGAYLDVKLQHGSMRGSIREPLDP